MTSDTIFGKIIRREIPAQIVYEDDQCLAFRDINPQAPVHVLIIPKRAIAQIEQIAPEDAALVGHLVWAATEVARREGLTEGYRLVINNGPQGGQTVYHLHLHLMGGRAMGWPPG